MDFTSYGLNLLLFRFLLSYIGTLDGYIKAIKYLNDVQCWLVYSSLATTRAKQKTPEVNSYQPFSPTNKLSHILPLPFSSLLFSVALLSGLAYPNTL